MKRFTLLFCICICALFVTAPLAASDAFNRAVENSRTQDDEEEAQESKNRSASSSSSSSDSVADSFAEAFFKFFFEMCLDIWAHNLSVRYAPYPYCYDGEKFIVDEDIDDFSSDDDYNLRHFSFDTSVSWLGDMGIGNESHIDCMFLPFLGVRTENLILCETAFAPDLTGNVRMSMQVPIMQTNPASWYLDMGASIWYGDVHSLLKDPGFLIGLEFRSYPVKPITLRWRMDWQEFADDVEIFDSTAEIGFMISRWELFAGYRYLNVGNDNNNRPEASWHGATLGARLNW